MWISKSYETLELPKEKKYLLKYFRTKIQTSFLQYYFAFGEYNNFRDHTGIDCQIRWLNILFKKMQILEQIRQKARSDMDMKTLARIEAGKYKLSKELDNK